MSDASDSGEGEDFEAPPREVQPRNKRKKLDSDEDGDASDGEADAGAASASEVRLARDASRNARAFNDDAPYSRATRPLGRVRTLSVLRHTIWSGQRVNCARNAINSRRQLSLESPAPVIRRLLRPTRPGLRVQLIF